jgi:7,8-dihydroneopterin aldolase/epimerase/oxygenase
MGWIALEGLEFFAYHGFFDEERKIGNRYEVDIRVETDFDQASEDDLLEHTVDYGQLYQMVSKEMKHPTKLLERLAGRIAGNILQEIKPVKQVEISVSKLNPPLRGLCKRSRITLSKSRTS